MSLRRVTQALSGPRHSWREPFPYHRWDYAYMRCFLSVGKVNIFVCIFFNRYFQACGLHSNDIRQQRRKFESLIQPFPQPLGFSWETNTVDRFLGILSELSRSYTRAHIRTYIERYGYTDTYTHIYIHSFSDKWQHTNHTLLYLALFTS